MRSKWQSPTITEGRKMAQMPPIHPGEVLLEEFLKPMGISQYRLAKDINVPPRRINEIVHGKRSITADTALRLARYALEQEKDLLGERLNREVRPLQSSSG